MDNRARIVYSLPTPGGDFAQRRYLRLIIGNRVPEELLRAVDDTIQLLGRVTGSRKSPRVGVDESRIEFAVDRRIELTLVTKQNVDRLA